MADSRIADLARALSAPAAADFVAVDDGDAAGAGKTTITELMSAGSALTETAAVNYTGTTDTLALSDAHALLYYSNAALVTVTVPTNASVAFNVGTRIVLLSTGAGGLTLTTTSLTLLGSSPNKTIAQNEAIYLEKVATDTWAVIGGTAA